MRDQADSEFYRRAVIGPGCLTACMCETLFATMPVSGCPSQEGAASGPLPFAQNRKAGSNKGVSVSKYLVEVVTTEPQPIWPDSYLDEVIGAWTGPPPQRPEATD